MNKATTKPKRARNGVGSGEFVRRLGALEKHWLKEAAGFHSMGKRMSREGNMAGNEYMQTAAAFRACARDLEAALVADASERDMLRNAVRNMMLSLGAGNAEQAMWTGESILAETQPNDGDKPRA